MTPAPPIVLEKPVPHPKASVQYTFDGTKGNLRAFLGQTSLYVSTHQEEFPHETSKVLWVISLLEGHAFNWIEPYFEDYMNPDNHNSNGAINTRASVGTRKIFTMKGLTEEMKVMFGDINEVFTAETLLLTIKQKGSVREYTALFRQQALRLSWGDDAFKAQFYRGLKPEVKDELVRSGKPADLAGLIAKAIEVDDRITERQQEKRFYNEGSGSRRNHGYKKNQYRQNANAGTVIKPKNSRPPPKNQGNLSLDERNRRKEKGLCFTCGKPGHTARDCGNNANKNKTPKGKKAWKKKNKQASTASKDEEDVRHAGAAFRKTDPWEIVEPVASNTVAVLKHGASPWTQCFDDSCYLHYSSKSEAGLFTIAEEDVGATPEKEGFNLNHACLSWTACYDDSCQIHYSDKSGSGWWPQAPRRKKTLFAGSASSRSLPTFSEGGASPPPYQSVADLFQFVEDREERNPRVGERWYIGRTTETARLWIRQDGEYVHAEALRGWEPPLTFRDEFEVKYVDDTRIGYFGITESSACTH